MSSFVQRQAHRALVLVVGEVHLLGLASGDYAFHLGRDQARDPGEPLHKPHLRVALADLLAEVLLGSGRNHAPEDDDVDVLDVVVVQDIVELIRGVRWVTFAAQDLDGFEKNARAAADHENPAQIIRG